MPTIRDDSSSNDSTDSSDEEVIVFQPRRIDPAEPVLDRGLALGQLVEGMADGGRRASKTPKTPAPSANSPQFLYIQMEFCQGQTLREMIDKVQVCDPFALRASTCFCACISLRS